MLSLKVIRYIAEEVDRQGDDALHVAYMCEAWKWVTKESEAHFGKVGTNEEDSDFYNIACRDNPFQVRRRLKALTFKKVKKENKNVQQ